MPDKQLTIATYAAGASLAAITLVYVFAPTFFIDGDVGGSGGGRKKGVVGLVNPANDCFINSVLQALAGLGDLRIYLIRETHRRDLDGKSVYTTLVEDPRRKIPAWKLEGLQRGIVTRGLKDMLDALNERPLYKKTTSAAGFVHALEDAFRQRISRQQQDAQEFLQVVAERLCDEYHAGHRARRARHGVDGAGQSSLGINEKSLNQELSRLAVDEGHAHAPNTISLSEESMASNNDSPAISSSQNKDSGEMEATYDDEEGFPLEGKVESRIECLTCGFKPKPSNSTFCTLTLNVPQVGSTTLNTCFDGMFKTEYIDDFKCEKCRLVHAVEMFQHEIGRSSSEQFKKTTREAIDSLKISIESDPEKPPKGVELPDSKFAPKRRIARHIRITKFPKIMAIHLSRSIFDTGRSSLKNLAKVSFPERLPLGGLLDQKKYKLLGLVTHKGSHNSGHYESFRRQNIYPPFSTPNTFEKSGVYSKSGTPIISTISTPQVSATQHAEDPISSPPTPELLSPPSPTAATPPASSRPSFASSLSAPQSRSSIDSQHALPKSPSRSRPNSGPTSGPRREYSPKPSTVGGSETNSLRSVARSARTTLSKVPNSISQSISRSSPPRPSSSPSALGSPRLVSTTEAKTTTVAVTAVSETRAPPSRRKKTTTSDRWWRISDEKIKESKTVEVLNMQREVYLLFYELEKGGEVVGIVER